MTQQLLDSPGQPAGQAPRLRTTPEAVRDNAFEYGDTTAMRRKRRGIWEAFTWAEVWRISEEIGAGLLAQPGADLAPVAIIGDNEPELYWSEYGAQAIGRVTACFYPDMLADELTVALRKLGCTVAIVEDQEQCDKVLSIADDAGVSLIVYWDSRGMYLYDDPRLVSLDELRRIGRGQLDASPTIVADRLGAVDATDTAVIIYTSGTSGVPKGVKGSFTYLSDVAYRYSQVMGATQFANYLSYVSPASPVEQYVGITLGAALPLTINFPEEPETVNDDIRELGAEYLYLAPRQWEEMLSSSESRIHDAKGPVRALYHWGIRTLGGSGAKPAGLPARLAARLLIKRPLRDRLGLAKVKAAVNAGGGLSHEVYDFFDALGVPIRNVYGFTEVGIVTGALARNQFGTAGTVLHSPFGPQPIEVRVVDSEIQVRGGVESGGYWGDEISLDSRRTEDGWVRSGDAGIFEDGVLHVLDRLENIKALSTGHTFAPQALEVRARLSPFIREAVVLGDETRPFPAALIEIDYESVARWAEDRSLSFGSFYQLSQLPGVVEELIRGELARINATFPEESRVVRFAAIPKPLDADDGELTRSLKVRRSVVEEHFAGLIDALYNPDERSHSWEMVVQLQDGRSRTLAMTALVRSVAEERQ